MGEVWARCIRAAAILCTALIAVVGGTGCVHVYQPMSGLHGPVVVDIQAPNFEDLNLTVHCVPGDQLNRLETSTLCRKVGSLFENQGAKVHTIDTSAPVKDVFKDVFAEETEVDPDEPPPPLTDLTLELRTREVRETDDPISWFAYISTGTLLPAITEYTHTIDVVVRDGSGFLLARDTIEGRIVRRMGLGVWAGNKLLDVAWRDDADKVTGEDVANAELSADLYGQLSQLTFNAKMQWTVLQESTPATAEEVP